MSKLSPAALAVWSAFLDHYEWEVTQTELRAVAAALRAVELELAYVNDYGDYLISADKLSAIVDELEAQ